MEGTKRASQKDSLGKGTNEMKVMKVTVGLVYSLVHNKPGPLSPP